MTSINAIGFMQGRLSPIKNGRIQSFPWGAWQEEFRLAKEIRMQKIEWTIDSENFSENPLLLASGRSEIRLIKDDFDIETPSVTCDYFMENPPWKSDSDALNSTLKQIISGMSEIDSRILVIPLVDNSSVASKENITITLKFFERLVENLKTHQVKIAFETDLDPESFSEFINEYDSAAFGVNYDIGNSASLGFAPKDEFAAFGNRVINVHVKDRVLGGTTVPLGTGAANFPQVFECLKEVDYEGNLILQTARAKDGNHLEVLNNYRNQVVEWMEGAK